MLHHTLHVLVLLTSCLSVNPQLYPNGTLSDPASNQLIDFKKGFKISCAFVFRDVRGFALKFYTKEGIWDLVGNNSPVIPFRDPFGFISIIHAAKRNPRTNLLDLNSLWDFFSLNPETLHHIFVVYTDQGTPDGYRYMDGFGVNTLKLTNAKGDVFYCKFHYKSDQGLRTLTAARAKKLAAEDIDYAVRDLYNAIATGDFPSWTVYIQVLTPQEAANFPWNILDDTKIWPEDMVSLIRVGKFVLNRNPKNFFAEVEQAAYSPSRLVPGIESSNDKILQARLFAYNDHHLHRLGTNYLQVPVNSPHHVFNTQRDGEACYTDNQDGEPNYYPSSFINQINSPRGRIPPFPTHGNVDRYNSSGEDNFSQPRMLWRSYRKMSDRPWSKTLQVTSAE